MTGAFENGDASSCNGTQIVSRSLSLKSPVIYVSFNYRLNGWFSHGQFIGSMTDFNQRKHLDSLAARRYRRQGLGISGFMTVSLRMFVTWWR